MTGNDKILTSVNGAVATLTFNNPERHNAMSFEMWNAAAEAVEALGAEPAVRVVILTGAGGKAFVSGADISKFESERGTANAVAIYNAATDRLHDALLDCAKPTIALIRGFCMGGGMNIAACCDLRIANEAACFAIPAAKLGVGYGYSSIRRLMDLIAPQFVQEILFTARQFDAADALRVGLVNRIVSDTQIEAEVRGLAATIATNAPLTIQAAKRIVREVLKDPRDRDVEACETLVRKCFESADYQEGRRAFMEKRKPAFTGK